jgi:tetratricopeptide (TPR) repeat protein
MKRYLLITFLVFLTGVAFAQTKPKPKTPSQSDMNKAMEDAMKDMSEEDKAEMRKMMKNVMPEMTAQSSNLANYSEFTSNKQLVPPTDKARINAIPKKKLQQEDMSGYASTLLNKIMTKGDAAEMAIVKKVIAQSAKANDIGGAAILCMLQGHPQAALALSMKAVQAEPSNVNWQNNMASLLTQYGYPEQAIPVLQKLKNQFPQNSTVLNNLGQAWLALGEIDSANVNITKAGGLNPNHPESKETEGVIEEVKGNTEKATDDYIKAMENAINPFTEALINNNKAQSKLNKIDFEKIKRSITIYEYFPRNWITIPKLSDSVSGYENDMRIKNGYAKMFEELESKIDALKEGAMQEINALAEKGETAFIKEMTAETQKGYNMMSKPAVTVQKILQIYVSEWMMDYTKEHQEFHEMISKKKQEMTKTGKNDNCADFDRKNDAFLQYANPVIREFHIRKIEEFRCWLNAFCTWIWYIAGNPKNTVIVQCISWTAALEQLYKDAIEEQNTEWRSCVKHDGDAVAEIASPAIPNFTCPTKISIPMGGDWQQLSNDAKNFDGNSFGIKKASNPIPNGSTAYTTDHNTIAQAGKDPFTKTASGSVSPGMRNDDELTPLSKILDDLTPLPDLQRNKLTKLLLKKMMTADCKNVTKYKPVKFEVGLGELIFEDEDPFEVGLGELVVEEPTKKIKNVKEDGDVVYVTYDDGSEVVFMADGSILEIDAPINRGNTGKNKVSIKPKPITPDVTSKNKIYSELKDAKKQFDTNGLQPSISSGLQAPGTFSPIKGLFE